MCVGQDLLDTFGCFLPNASACSSQWLVPAGACATAQNGSRRQLYTGQKGIHKESNLIGEKAS